MAFTVDQVVAADIATTDAINALSEKHAAEMAPLIEKQQLCRAWLLKHLNDTGAENIRTEHGTAYKSTVMSATVDKEHDGWQKLLAYAMRSVLLRASEVLETHGGDDVVAFEEAIAAATGAPELDLFNRSVNKTAVKGLMEDKNFDPATIGVKTTSVVNLNIKRA